MVAYSFNSRFEAAIKSGTKAQTIRAPRARHARPGELLQLYCGMRTTACRRIMPDQICTTVSRVSITFDSGGKGLIERIYVEGARVRSLDDFARQDGFADIREMTAFWLNNHPETAALGFIGVLIQWKPQNGGAQK